MVCFASQGRDYSHQSCDFLDQTRLELRFDEDRRRHKVPCPHRLWFPCATRCGVNILRVSRSHLVLSDYFRSLVTVFPFDVSSVRFVRKLTFEAHRADVRWRTG